MYLIVGGSRGFGLSLANELSRSNHVLCLARKISENKYNKNIKFLSFDINKKKEREKIFKILEKKKISGIFYTVGAVSNNDNIYLNNNEIDKILFTNFYSIYKFNSYVIKKNILNKNSLICFCSSISTFVPRSKQVLYAASKAALNSYFFSLSRSSVSANIRIVNIILGYMNTDMSKNVVTFFRKEDPIVIAKKIVKNIDTLNGIIYLPKYWHFINIIIKLLPESIKRFLIRKID